MEDTLIPDLGINKPDDVIINDVVSSHDDDDRSSGPENDYERRGADGVDSEPLEMEKGAEKGLEVNGSVATNDVALSQSDELLINQTGSVGIDSNKSTIEEITEMLKLLKMEEGSGEDLEVNISCVANDVALSQSDDLLIDVSSSSTLAGDQSSGPRNGFEQRGAVGVDSDISSGKETEEIPMVLEMEESAEKDLDVNGSGAATSATLSQVNDFLITQVEAVGTESDTSVGADIKEMSPGKDYEMEESAEKDLEVNGSGAANSVTFSQVNDLLINKVGAVGTESDTSIVDDIKETSHGKECEMEESAEKDLDVNGSGVASSATLSQVNALLVNQVEAVETESATSIAEVIEETSAGNDYEMEESAEEDLELNGSGAANSVTLSPVNDLLIDQVGAVGTESATSKGEDIEETSAGNDYEIEESAEKDLEVNGSGAASSASLSQVGAAGTESDTSIGDDIKDTRTGKDYEVNGSVAANDVAISRSDDIVINHIGAVGIELNKTTYAEIKEMPKLLAMEESSGNDLETNILVANNDVALSQSDDLLIAVSSSSSTISKNQSSDEYITQPELLEMEESAGKHPEMNRSSAANNVLLSLSDDLLINQIGADGIDSNKSTIEEIKEKPKLIEVEESFGNDLEANISVADNDVTSYTSSDLLITVSSLSTLSDDQSSGEDIKEPELLNMEENAGNDLEVNTLSAANNVALSQSTDLLNHNGVVGTDFNRSASEVINEMPELPELEEGAMKDPEMNISVADNDGALCQGDDLLITVSSSSTLYDNQSSGEDIKEPELLNMEENAGTDLEVNTLTAANDVALSQSTDLLNHSGVVGTDFNRSACEVIKEIPKLPELEEGAVKDPETNISVANNDVSLCQGDDLMITVSSSSTLSDNQFSGHGNETSSELIETVAIDADKPGSEETLEMPKLLVTPEPEKSRKNVKFNLRKSLAWDSAFFTSDGVLDADELSTMMEGGVKNAKHQLPGIEEEVYRSMDSISTLESDNLSLECLEAELFEDIRASIQKSNRSSSNLNNSSIKVSSGKKDSQSKVFSSSKKVDTDSEKRPAARMKHTTSSIPQPKIVSRVNSSSTLTLTKRASLSANHAKKDQDIARQPHVIQKGMQAARATTQGSKLIGPHRGVPKPSLSSKASPMGSSTALKTEPTRPSSSHSNSSSCSSGTDVKSSATLSRKKIDTKSSKLTTTAVPKTPSRVIMKNKPQPPANSRVSSHSVLSTMSSSISPASSISEWSSESSSSTTNNNRRSESRGSTDTIVSYRSLDNDASGQSASNILPTGRISNQNGNQPVSQSGSLARPPCVQPTGLRMPSPKIGFFDGGKSGARTPNGGNIRPQSKLPTGIPKIGATHSNPIISNGVKSGKIPPPKTGAAHTIMKPNPQKAAPKPSQEQPKTKSSLVTSDASNPVTDGSRTPFAVKNSEAY